jgi:pimeloyl-ACP methyl ester carboxylesterase
MHIEHGRIALELHELAGGSGEPLLLLHELGGCTDDWRHLADVWPGPVYALDFCGHGASDWVKGAAYTPELLVADADAALGVVGQAVLAGAGLGAYVALLLAGTRSDTVPAALLCPGKGLDGGGATPEEIDLLPPFQGLERNGRTSADGYDPHVCILDHDVRPPDYASAFAARARFLLLCEDGGRRPPWWQELRHCPAAQTVAGDARAGLHRLAAVRRGE